MFSQFRFGEKNNLWVASKFWQFTLPFKAVCLTVSSNWFEGSPDFYFRSCVVLRFVSVCISVFGFSYVWGFNDGETCLAFWAKGVTRSINDVTILRIFIPTFHWFSAGKSEVSRGVLKKGFVWNGEKGLVFCCSASSEWNGGEHVVRTCFGIQRGGGTVIMLVVLFVLLYSCWCASVRVLLKWFWRVSRIGSVEQKGYS